MPIALAIIALLFIAGGASLVFGVYLLIGVAWAFIVCGVLLGAVAFYLRLRLPQHG